MRFPALAVVALAGGLVPAGAAAQVGLPETAVPDVRGECVAKKGRLCVEAPAKVDGSARGVSALTSSARIRRGFGLPSPRTVLGRRAGAKLKKADRRFAREMAGPLRESKRALAAASARLRRGVNVSNSATNGRSGQRRQARLELEVEVCPSTPSPANSHGRITLAGRATYAVETVSRRGRRYVLELVNFDLRISRDGLVSHRAEYAGFPPDPDRLRVSRSRSFYDPATRRSRDEAGTHFDFQVTSLDPEGIAVDFDPSNFDRWIDRATALDRGDFAPEPPDTLAGRSYLTAARQFVRWVAVRVREVVREAERNWRTPNKCVKLRLDGPAKLAPGAQAQVAGTLTHVGGAATDAGLYGAYVHFGANYIHGGSATPLATLPLDMGEPWYQYTAPQAPWADSQRPGLDVTATTKGGIGQATITFELTSLPAAYNGSFSGSATYDENELGAGNHLMGNWNGNFHARSTGPSSPGATDASYGFESGSLQYTYSGRVGDCDVTGNGTIDLGTQPDFMGKPSLLYLVEGAPRKYQLHVPAPLVATVPGTKSNCEDPNDNGDAFNWPPGTGVPWMAYAPMPGGPVGDDWSIHGAGSGNTGSGSPDQTWNWNLTPAP